MWTLAILQRPGGQLLPMVLMYGGILAILYFMLIRPQRQVQKRHLEVINALKRGDEVMTEGGIIGEVVFLKDNRITLKTAESTRIVVARQKIARVMTPEDNVTTTTEQK
jgi:preprotein translocase subunit YajC